MGPLWSSPTLRFREYLRKMLNLVRFFAVVLQSKQQIIALKTIFSWLGYERMVRRSFMEITNAALRELF